MSPRRGWRRPSTTPARRERIKGIIRGLTGDAFDSGEIDAIFDEIVNNLPDEHVSKLNGIATNGSIALNQDQLRVISEQLDALSPQFKATVIAAFQKAIREGRVVVGPD